MSGAISVDEFESEMIFPSHCLYDKFYELFVVTFPSWERPCAKELEAQLNESECFLTVYHDGGDVVAFDIVEHYDVDGGSLGFVLLSYLGVSEEFQGLGLGSSILSSLVSRFAHKNFLLEAESRQARWYSKNGFVAFPISYASPSFECDSSVPMSLMVYSVERRDALFSLGTMVGVVTSLYRHGYGLAENDRRLVDVLCSVRAEFL